jgi:hypothetical protein
VEIYAGFRHTFGRKIDIKFLGLWDTVSSVGWAWNPQYFQFTAHNPYVKIVRHAVALDERRTYFKQNLWASANLPPGQDVKQVWFPGVHCDVGGGYVESEAGLSGVALKWMAEEAEVTGLRFHPKAKASSIPAVDSQQYAAPNPLEKKHESPHGLWWVVEFIPKRIKHPQQKLRYPVDFALGALAIRARDAIIHQAVIDRMRGDVTYRPSNIGDPLGHPIMTT